MLEHGSPQQNEEWVTYPDGSRRLLGTIKTPYRAPDGTIVIASAPAH